MMEKCALWMPERVIKADFQVMGGKWQDKELVLPAHCSINKEQAEAKAFSRVTSEGEMDEEKAPGNVDNVHSKAHNSISETKWYNSIYEQ